MALRAWIVATTLVCAATLAAWLLAPLVGVGGHLGPPSARAAPLGPEVYGPKVKAQDYSWQVAIRINRGSGWACGGILINRQYILTAAHCVDPASDIDWDHKTPVAAKELEVYFGADQYASGAKLALDPDWGVRLHPNWKTTKQKYAWDAALLKLAAPVSGARPAPIRAMPFTTGQAVTSGWGAYDNSNKSSEVLRAAKVPVISNEECRTKLAADQVALLGSFSLCAESATGDSCVRDSGGPLVAGEATNPQTIGVVSWGPPRRCGVPGPSGKLLGVYTRASEIADWAQTETGDATVVTRRALGETFDVTPNAG